MSVAAGKLRHRITIQAKQTSQDLNTGVITESWTNLYTDVPASMEPLSAREFIAAQATQSEVRIRCMIRYRPGLDASMRVIHRGFIHNIVGVLPDNVSGLEYITLPLTEGVNAG